MNPDPNRPWLQFVGAKTSGEFAHAWLELIVSKNKGITAGVVLVQDPAQQTFMPLATWPQASQEFSRFGPVIQQVLANQQGHVQTLPGNTSPEAPPLQLLAYPLLQGEALVGVVALEFQTQFNTSAALFQQVHWGSAWLLHILSEKALNQALKARQQLLSVLENIVTALGHEQLQQALFEVSNSVRRQLNCSRVAIGLAQSSQVQVKAISDSATFEKNANLVKNYTRLMAQAMDSLSPVHSNHETPPAYSLAYPLVQAGQCAGVLVLEREQTPFTDEDLPWLAAFSGVFAAVLEQRLKAEQGFVAKGLQCLRKLSEKLLGRGHYVWKMGFSALALAALVLFVIPFQYRVAAPTVIEGEIQRVVAAPFDGFVSASFARAGDTVKTGQALAQLDDRELRLEQAQWASASEQHSNKLRNAMANGELSQVQVLGAQLQEAQAQLQQVTEKISRAQLKAPLDGIVISGDLSQQIGGPVQLGKTLFEVAPLATYRIVLQVDEREIRHVQLGQTGKLLMTGLSDKPMRFAVSKITPLATTEEGRNFFRIEASLAHTAPRLRPGMEGIGKIEIGDRSLWWISTRSLNEWLALTLWKWTP